MNREFQPVEPRCQEKSMARRILIIDDDPSVVLSIRTRLEIEEFVVIGAYSGASGLEKARQEHPDLIILDVMMPGINGRQVLRQLKNDPVTEHIRVLMLTALGEPDEVAKSLDRGAEWHLVKPFDVEELVMMVRRLMDMPDE